MSSAQATMEKLLGALLLAAVTLVGRTSAAAQSECAEDAQGVHGYNFTLVDEVTEINLGLRYSGKVLLVVNVATF